MYSIFASWNCKYVFDLISWPVRAVWLIGAFYSYSYKNISKSIVLNPTERSWSTIVSVQSVKRHLYDYKKCKKTKEWEWSGVVWKSDVREEDDVGPVIVE